MKHFALILRTVAAWAVTLLIVFPLIWLVITAFKTEQQAIAIPPQLFFTPTMESFAEVNLRSDYLLFARNSVITSVISTLLGLAIAAPAWFTQALPQGVPLDGELWAGRGRFEAASAAARRRSASPNTAATTVMSQRWMAGQP